MIDGKAEELTCSELLLSSLQHTLPLYSKRSPILGRPVGSDENFITKKGASVTLSS